MCRDMPRPRLLSALHGSGIQPAAVLRGQPPRPRPEVPRVGRVRMNRLGFCCQYSSPGSVGSSMPTIVTAARVGSVSDGVKTTLSPSRRSNTRLELYPDNGLHARIPVAPCHLIGGHSPLDECHAVGQIGKVLKVPARNARSLVGVDRRLDQQRAPIRPHQGKWETSESARARDIYSGRYSLSRSRMHGRSCPGCFWIR